MKQMRVEQLFVEGKYMVIYLSPETAVYDELGYYLWNKDGETFQKKILFWNIFKNFYNLNFYQIVIQVIDVNSYLGVNQKHLFKGLESNRFYRKRNQFQFKNNIFTNSKLK